MIVEFRIRENRYSEVMLLLRGGLEYAEIEHERGGGTVYSRGGLPDRNYDRFEEIVLSVGMTDEDMRNNSWFVDRWYPDGAEVEVRGKRGTVDRGDFSYMFDFGSDDELVERMSPNDFAKETILLDRTIFSWRPKSATSANWWKCDRLTSCRRGVTEEESL